VVLVVTMMQHRANPWALYLQCTHSSIRTTRTPEDSSSGSMMSMSPLMTGFGHGKFLSRTFYMF
jgi:hypothetical protein